DIKGRVAQQVERERQAIRRRAASASSRRDRANLAGAETEASRVECAPERQPNLGVAVPAEVDDRALRAEQVERALESRGRRAGVHDQVTIACGLVRRREVDAERVR